jgi:hypothetical protein
MFVAAMAPYLDRIPERAKRAVLHDDHCQVVACHTQKAGTQKRLSMDISSTDWSFQLGNIRPELHLHGSPPAQSKG